METLNKKQRKVIEKALQGNHLFVTGSGGVGKSYVLSVLVDHLVEKYSKDRVAVTAMTGIAAVPINGRTLHSFFGRGLTLDNERYKWNKELWKITKVLIIDEVSMLTCEFFDLIYKDVLAYDIQLILFGDFFQLPPIEGKPCFMSENWNTLGLIDNTIVLDEIVRQKDINFINTLNGIRKGKITKKSLDFLKSLEITMKKIPDRNKITKLYALNRDVDYENLIELKKLEGDITILHAEDSYIPVTAKNKRLKQLLDKEAVSEIKIKIGARVMLTRNLQGSHYVNGSTGIVTDIQKGVVYVVFDNEITKCGITPIEYTVAISKPKAKATRLQYPLKLAWSISIHKSQGMTLDNVYAHVTGSFEKGQIYTVLSRVKSPEGLYIDDVDYILKKIKVCRDAKRYYKLFE